MFEWVEDCVHGNYNEAPADGSAWLEAHGGNCEYRVIRCGSWTNFEENVRTSYRMGAKADDRTVDLGFRLAQDLP